MLLVEYFKNLIPSSIYGAIKSWVWAYTDWVSYKSYSGEGEDMILRKIFYNKNKGFYIDIGAYHPKKSSNTYFFYKKGWNGINIDAMPGSMQLFNRLRKRDINLEIPIGGVGEEVRYCEFEDKALNGFESDTHKGKDQTKPQNKLKKIHKLRSRTLNSILETHLPKGQSIDFISIDVEGQELNILQNLDFTKYRPNWLLIEIWDFDYMYKSHNLVFSFLSRMGYSVEAKTLNTVFFRENKNK